MRVYVESNFLLEIVRQQEESGSAQELLEFARQGRLELAVPAFCLAEPYWTLGKDGTKRAGYLDELSREIAQLRRSVNRVHLAANADQLINQLRELEFNERLELNQVVDDVCRTARVVALGADTVRGARALAFQTMLTMQDALVLASVMEDLLANPAPEHCAFISRDRKAFRQVFGGGITFPLIESSGCKYIPSFTNAVAFVKERLRS